MMVLRMRFGMSYKNTLIIISEDSPVKQAVISELKNGKPTAALLEYDIIKNCWSIVSSSMV